MYHWCSIMGRPLGHLMLWLQFKLVNGTSQQCAARLIALVGVVGLLLATYTFLRKENIPNSLSSFLALGVAALPGVLISIAWIGAGFIIYSLCFPSISALLCQHALKLKARKSHGYWCLLTISSILLILSSLIYQTGTMFFIVFVAVYWALHWSRRDPYALNNTFTLLSVLFVANVVYFIGFKALVGSELASADPQRGVFFDTLGEGLVWFFHLALPRALSLWTIQPSYGWNLLPCIASTIFLASVVTFLIFTYRLQPTLFHVMLILLYLPSTFVLGIACYIPMLISNFRLEVYRSMVPLSTYAFVITCIHLWVVLSRAIVSVKYISSITIAVFSFLIAFNANNAMREKIVATKSAEVQFMRQKMQQIKDSGLEGNPIHVIIPILNEPWNTDEIGSLSITCVNDIQPMISIIRRELKLPDILISNSKIGETYNLDGTEVIDGRDVIDFTSISDLKMK